MFLGDVSVDYNDNVGCWSRPFIYVSIDEACPFQGFEDLLAEGPSVHDEVDEGLLVGCGGCQPC